MECVGLDAQGRCAKRSTNTPPHTDTREKYMTSLPYHISAYTDVLALSEPDKWKSNEPFLGHYLPIVLLLCIGIRFVWIDVIKTAHAH